MWAFGLWRLEVRGLETGGKTISEGEMRHVKGKRRKDKG
jgi:hypothetical protein